MSTFLKIIKDISNQITYATGGKIYQGYRVDDGTLRGLPYVVVNNNPLYSMWIDSDGDEDPDVFEWGYRGLKAKNLAVSILVDHFEDANFPKELVYLFNKYFISTLPFHGWEIKSKTIDKFLNSLVGTQYE